MLGYILVFILGNAFHVQGIHDEEFPQWSLSNWIIQSEGKNVITLPCHDDSYYPFNDSRTWIKVEWILPERTAYLHLAPGEENAGWSVSADDELTIDKRNLNIPEAADGMYVCAVLAKVGENYAWHYLRWGVGLYSDVAAMKVGGIERYNSQFLVAGIATLVYAVCIILLAVSVQFRYKGGPVDEKGEKEYASDYDGKSQVSVNMKDNFFEVL